MLAMLTKLFNTFKQTYEVWAGNRPRRVVSLTENNFRKSISKGYVFVKFFVPWCEHCQKLAPKWLDLSMRLSMVTNLTLAEVDCSENVSLYDEYLIENFPTLILFRDGYKLAQHRGPKELDSMYWFVMEHIKEQH